MPKHTTVSGWEFEYPDPDPALASIIRKLTVMAGNPRVTYGEMLEVAFSDRNPLLGPYVVPGMGQVTTDTLGEPAWYVIQDLLAQKQLQEKRINLEKLAEDHTLSIPAAGQAIGLSTAGAQNAIRAHRLPVWMRDGRAFVSPRNAALYKMGNTGPKTEERVRRELKSEPLTFRRGNIRGLSLRILTSGAQASVELHKGPRGFTDGTIRDWESVAVMMGLAKDYRFVLLKPRAKVGEPDELPHQEFYIRGYFLESHTENTSEDAHAAWTEFKKKHRTSEAAAESDG